MSVLVLLIFVSLAVATTFLMGFIWAVRSGQYEDTSTPSMRILMEDSGRPGGAPAEFGVGVPGTVADVPAVSADPVGNFESVKSNTRAVSPSLAGSNSPA